MKKDKYTNANLEINNINSYSDRLYLFINKNN